MKRLSRGGLAASVLLASGVLSACGPRQPWQSELVSVNAAGTGGGNGPSVVAFSSPDGTKVAFTSEADDLGPTDTNDERDVYLRDLTSGETTLVSVNDAGTDSGNALSEGATFSPDGTKLLFTSEATDLGPTDTNRSQDLYVRDLVTGTTTLVSANAAGAGVGTSYAGAFSADGTKVVFESFAPDLVPADTNYDTDIFVRELVSETTTLVSVNAAGVASGSGGSHQPSFSPDGTKVVFWSFATDLGPTDSGGDYYDVYVRDLVAGTTTLVSTNAAGTDSANSHSGPGIFSPDGTKIAFQSYADDLGPTDTNHTTDVYLRDLATGTTTLVSGNDAGTGSGNGESQLGTFSPDGTKIAFHSFAADLGPTDSGDYYDVYVRDLVAGTTTLVSTNAAGTDSGDGSSGDPAFSPDGTKISFRSEAGNLGPTDTNGVWDIYVRDLPSGTTTLVSSNVEGTDSGDASSPSPVTFSPDGRRVLFVSDASNLGPAGDSNGHRDVFLATLRGADLSVRGEVEPDPVEPGGALTYRFDVANGGPDPAGDAAVAFLLPEGTLAADVQTSQGECGAPTGSRSLVACDLGDLPVDGTAELTLWANSDSPAGTEITVLAIVNSEPTADPVHGNNTTHVTTVARA